MSCRALTSSVINRRDECCCHYAIIHTVIPQFKKWFVILLYVVVPVFTYMFYLSTVNNPSARAVALMAAGLIFFWIYVFGGLMFFYREKVRLVVLNLPGDWRVKFVLFATLLAMIEEGIAVAMTNLAPLFGAEIGKAYITASTNYLDVVLFHSVIVFIPLIIALMLLLSRCRFSVLAVFLIFGTAGTLAEAIYSGSFSSILLGYQWVLVYGLMVYLPAYSLPNERPARVPHWWHLVMSVPALYILSAPLLIPVVLVITKMLHHPGTHF